MQYPRPAHQRVITGYKFRFRHKSINTRTSLVNTISWVRQKKCKTKLSRTAETEELFKLIERAEKWLRENTYTTRILKWETKEWGEIPADFGRK